MAGEEGDGRDGKAPPGVIVPRLLGVGQGRVGALGCRHCLLSNAATTYGADRTVRP